MPNWCRNELRISGNTSNLPFELAVTRLIELVKETLPNYEARLRRVAAINKDGRVDTEMLSKAVALEKRCVDLIDSNQLTWYPRSAFDFQNILPYPEEFIQQEIDYELLDREDFVKKYPDDPDRENAYNWRVSNWGTKWSATDTLYVPEQKTFYFDTAWGPCIPVISELHKLFPEMWFQYEYYEQGMGFIGGGEFIPEDHWCETDYTLNEVSTMEAAAKRHQTPVAEKWQAGAMYNPWSSIYMGFKGG